MTEFTLPVPPSTNQLYATGSGRRVKTRRYKAWIDEAGWSLLIQKPPVVDGKFTLSIWHSGRADLDNIKAVPDLLQSMGLVENDRLMVELHVYRSEGPFRISYGSLA